MNYEAKGRQIKQTFPGRYDDWPDDQLGRRFALKHLDTAQEECKEVVLYEAKQIDKSERLAQHPSVTRVQDLSRGGGVFDDFLGTFAPKTAARRRAEISGYDAQTAENYTKIYRSAVEAQQRQWELETFEERMAVQAEIAQYSHAAAIAAHKAAIERSNFDVWLMNRAKSQGLSVESYNRIQEHAGMKAIDLDYESRKATLELSKGTEVTRLAHLMEADNISERITKLIRKVDVLTNEPPKYMSPKAIAREIELAEDHITALKAQLHARLVQTTDEEDD